MPPLVSDFTVVLEQDVIWGDMDAFGHINNTVYFRYFEDVRLAYFNKIGMREYMERERIGPILARTHCDFRLPLDYPDRIRIATRGRILSPRKLNMEYAVFSESHGAVCAEGEGLIVYFDYANGRSCEIPASIVAAINSLEH